MINISQTDYQLRAGESISDYNARIAGLRGETAPMVQPAPTIGKTTADVLAESTRVAQEAAKMVGTTFTPGYSTTSQIQPTQVSAPELPTPQGPSIQEQYMQSELTRLQEQQKVFETASAKRMADTQEQIKAQQEEYNASRTQEKQVIEQFGSAALEEKSQKLAYLSEEKARFDENYNLVQGLASQLQGLLTTGNDLIQQQKDVTGLSSIRTPRINQTISDIASQAGVIEATISVYNGQMSQAQSQLTTATNVITSAYSDQLDYYKTLVNFYESKSADTNQKLITLTSDEKAYLDSQINYLENQITITQANAEAIKQAMTDPDMAMTYAQAGITLNDSPQQINEKLANYAYTKEVSNTSNEMSLNGYTFLAPGQSAPTGYEVVETTDSKGNVKRWAREADAETGGGIDISKADIQTILFNVGIPTAVS
ncbi:MAG: hypothetical protein PHW73_12805, partial [Atribacterota bacterium]|nr:hypothetical protein [Atribacterota bacterium]